MDGHAFGTEATLALGVPTACRPTAWLSPRPRSFEVLHRVVAWAGRQGVVLRPPRPQGAHVYELGTIGQLPPTGQVAEGIAEALPSPGGLFNALLDQLVPLGVKCLCLGGRQLRAHVVASGLELGEPG